MFSSYVNPDTPEHNAHSTTNNELESLQVQVERMRERERRLMGLLNASSAERLEHDLRNVLNELVLLRALLDPKSGQHPI